MYQKNKGIILRTTKYSESSIILDMYTLNCGRKSYIISGIRSRKSNTKAGILQVMGLVEFVERSKETNSLERMKEVKADYYYKRIPFEPLRSSLGFFVVEICAKSIKESEVNEQLYDFIRSSLLRVDEKRLDELSLYPIQFMLGLSKHLGFSIQNNYDENHIFLSLKEGRFTRQYHANAISIDEKESLFLHHIINGQPCRIPKIHRMKILDSLLTFYNFHIENFGTVKSLDVLRSIYS